MTLQQRLARWLVLGGLGLAWHALAAPRLGLGGAGPDPLLVILGAVALGEGPVVGSLAGFALGLLADLSQPVTLGLHAAAGALAGHLLGRFALDMAPGVPLVEWSAGAAAAAGYGVLVLVGRVLLAGGAFWRPLLTAVLPSAALTGLLLLPVLRLLERWRLGGSEW